MVQPSGVHVDRARELRRFEQMISNEGQAHVLLISAAEGMGKTTLLGEFGERAAGMAGATIALRKSYSPRDVLKRVCTRTGMPFPAFTDREAELYGRTGRRLAAVTTPLLRSVGQGTPGLSAQTHTQLRDALARTAHFQSDEQLRELFVQRDLSPWVGYLQDRPNPHQRADMIISQLYNRFHAETEQNALVLLVRVSAGMVDPGDSLRNELLALAHQLIQEVEPLLAEQRAGGAAVRVGGSVEGRRRRSYAWGEQAELQKQEQIELTDAFLEDLMRLRRDGQAEQFALLFDDFDQGNQEVKEWLGDYFLESVLPHRWLVVVIAGDGTPEVEIGQRNWCLSSSLSLLQVDDVREYVQRLELEVSPELIEAAYVASQFGVPFKLREFIESWLEYRTGASANAR